MRIKSRISILNIIGIIVITMILTSCSGSGSDDKGHLEYNAFNEGLYPVNVNGQWGYINYEGEMEIEPKYEWAS